MGEMTAKQIPQELRTIANDFLNSRRNANNLVDIIALLERNMQQKLPISPVVLTLEVVFVELLTRREMCVETPSLSKPKDKTAESIYSEWLLERYAEARKLILNNIEHEDLSEATQALTTSMKLLALEGKYPLDKHAFGQEFPKQRLRAILHKLASTKKSQSTLIQQQFKRYAEFVDVVFYSWKALHALGTRTAFKNETFALNYLELLHALPVTQSVYEQQKLLCSSPETATGEPLEYALNRRCINKVCACVLQWSDDTGAAVLKQLLIVLLERMLPHLEKPILLTDFLMDSLDCGGTIGLLALQGLFTLIQEHNITYPNIYAKLYSMFEPELFHTKYKARLFYLADIFLSSTHLPEGLVAAFAKRMARLSLIAPPQDTLIILYFIGNLILRHPGLKQMICAENELEVANDPYVMEEREPTQSNATKSSLWEIVTLQAHAIPSVASAARFISQPLPTTEWDMSAVLELKEDDLFDQEISKNAKQYALAFERPQSLFLPKNDKVIQYWQLF